ncbi:cytidine deaminase [Paraprevotella xylaniphila]|uniref:cytidine deaminase n=1 Tax=Paraprevotella xylaniphila TaxID=454155 RepID=UPI0010329969|nr:cytidine deaminase [Paraprevotella xylaniphila]
MKEKEIISKVRIYDYEELTDADRELIDKAKNATQTSYAPFSKFCVGAAARLSDGTIVTGSNQENAAFPSSLCAERTALFYANARYPEKSVEELAIAAYAHGTFLKSPIPPCGACRQVILGVEERYGRPIRILLFGEEGTYVVDSIKALLPLQFTGETMNE